MNNQKKCHKCGKINPEEAKFCAQCGSELKESKDFAQQKSKCKNCGELNPAGAKYCRSCGHALMGQASNAKKKRNPKAPQKYTPVKKQSSMNLKILAGIIGIAVIYMVSNTGKQPRPVTPQIKGVAEQTTGDAALEAVAFEISSKFICSCGTCGEQPLETCTCETAIFEKNYIRQELKQGKQKNEIIKLVNAKFGWIKPEFKKEYGAGKFSFNANVLSDQNLLTAKKDPIIENKLATQADRFMIYSKFACPCGQCSIPELQDCNCNHNKGAKEVKRFVENRIAEQKYSTAGIISMVENKYGNRIR